MLFHPLDILPSHPVGGKARALASLTQAGFDVPDWFVVTTDNDPLPDLTGPHAVRSSALDEDGLQQSFAGQYDSFLNIEAAQIAEHVAKVRSSATSDRLKSYRGNAAPDDTPPPAVIIQKMVPARFAGVAFGADPVTGRRSLTTISAIAGLGEALVSGEVDSHNYQVTADDEIAGQSDLLTPAQITAITSLTRRCNAHFGSPQDIEWAIDESDQLWLLQSRPITTLASLPDPADPPTVWDNSNIAESYGGVTCPLTYSFASRVYEHVYREFCKLLHVPKGKMTRHDDVFPQMLGHLEGRVYYNLVSWYRVLALLPGFSLNRSFMEQMMGVKEPMPGEIVNKIVADTRTSKWRDGLSLVKTTFGLIRSYLGLPKQIARFQARLDTALDLKTPLARLTTAELIAHYRDLEKKLLHRWDAPLVNDFFAMIFYGLLGKKSSDPNTYLKDTGDIISARPPRLIREMAEMVRPDRELAELLTSNATTARKLAEVRKFPDLLHKFQSYLDEFGDRCLEELKLESPTVTDDPGSLLQSIGTFALHSFKKCPSAQRASPHSAQKSDQIACPPFSPKPSHREARGKPGLILKFLISRTRTLVRNRENLRFERTRVFGRVRQVMRELGRRLAADHQLDSPDDVFYLTLDEVLETGVTRDLRSLAALRKREFEEYRASPPPPDRFTTRGPLHRHQSFAPDASPSPKTSDLQSSDLQGIGACAGIVKGPVRVVTDPREARLRPGEILVAAQTDPGWVVLFPAAAGLLVERGSLLSHSAIVARELNLPCIVSLSRISTTLKTGDLVEMNGQTGEVTLLPPPSA